MCTIVGFKKIVSKKDNSIWFEIHLTEEDRYLTDGVRAFNMFVSDDRIENIDGLFVDGKANVSYNRYGKPDRLICVL